MSGWGATLPTQGTLTCAGTTPATINGAGDVRAPSGSISLACTANWSWPGGDYPTSWTVQLVEQDGEGIDPPNPGHPFSLTRPTPAPHAAFTSAPGPGFGQFVFTSASTSVAGGMHEEWTADDGSSGVGPTWTHTFATTGTHEVTLWVEDTANGYDTRGIATHYVSFAGSPSNGSTTITIYEHTSPPKDSGRFALAVDAHAYATKTADGDVVVVNVRPGRHSVLQDAVNTPLTYYGVTLTCQKNGRSDLHGNAVSLTVHLASGDREACRFVDTRTTVKHCDVPNVVGKSLHAARSALKAWHCLTGRVTRPKSGKGRLVVRRQSQAPGSVDSSKAKIALWLRHDS